MRTILLIVFLAVGANTVCGKTLPPAAPSPEVTSAQEKFVHPGIPLTKEDLAELKKNITQEPWKTGYDQLVNDGHSKLDYKMRGPFESVSRNKHVHRNEWMSDMQAVWNLSRMWYFTGDAAYAQKAHDLLLSWAKTQKEFIGNEANLDLGDFAFKYVGGADILRGTWPGWTQADTDAVKALFEKVYWPKTGGGDLVVGPANKGALGMVSGAAIAVFLDDQEKLDRVLHLFRTSASSGMPNTLPTGQIGESGRDQGHAYGEWLSLAMLSEICWKQGIDVFAEKDNRLLAVGEYYARNNLGLPTPFIPMGSTDWFYLVTAKTAVWDHGRPGMEILHGAYLLRKKLTSPYLEMRRNELPMDSEAFMFHKVADTSTAKPLPSFTFPTTASVTELTGVDIGKGTPAGSSTYEGGTWTVKSNGWAMWTHGEDSLRFTYLKVTGDCAIIAKVVSVEPTSPNAKAGVMIRDSLDANAAHRAWIAMTAGQKQESHNHGWTGLWGGGNWEKKTLPAPPLPYWVKIERIGQVISTYSSPDGVSWGASSTGGFAKMGDIAYLGLAVCAESKDKVNTATFSDVRITGGDGKERPKVPAAPLAVLASPGDKQVPLRWLESFGTESYNVKRSTTKGGPYTNVTSVKGNSYIDTAVNNGDTYYYVVSAVNPVGESPDSPEDAVKLQKP